MKNFKWVLTALALLQISNTSAFEKKYKELEFNIGKEKLSPTKTRTGGAVASLITIGVGAFSYKSFPKSFWAGRLIGLTSVGGGSILGIGATFYKDLETGVLRKSPLYKNIKLIKSAATAAAATKEITRVRLYAEFLKEFYGWGSIIESLNEDGSNEENVHKQITSAFAKIKSIAEKDVIENGRIKDKDYDVSLKNIEKLNDRLNSDELYFTLAEAIDGRDSEFKTNFAINIYLTEYYDAYQRHFVKNQ